MTDTLVNAVRSFSLSSEKIAILSDPDTPIHELVHFLRSQGHELLLLTDLSNNLDDIEKHASIMNDFQPTLLFGLGKKETVDAAKLLRLLHDNRHISVEKLTAPFIEYERHDDLLGLRRNLCLVVAPSLPDSTDMSPFTQTIVRGKDRVNVYAQSLRPNIVVYDFHAVDKEELLKQSYVMFLQGIEAFVSTSSNEQSRQMILDALRQIFFQLKETHPNPQKMLDACAQLSLAISNSGVGLGTSMATQMSSVLQIPFSSVLVALMPHIVEYNSSPCPQRGAVSPLYPYPMAGIHYSLLATALGLKQPHELIRALSSIGAGLGFGSLRPLVGRNPFLNNLETLCGSTFADPLHSTNPRMVFLSDIRRLYCQILNEE
jgi:alcohol dehydrogenase class IV